MASWYLSEYRSTTTSVMRASLMYAKLSELSFNQAVIPCCGVMLKVYGACLQQIKACLISQRAKLYTECMDNQYLQVAFTENGRATHFIRRAGAGETPALFWGATSLP